MTLPFLTTYRPNFCCECGDKIVRLRWHVWTSRKFCDKCSRIVAGSRWLQPAATMFLLLLVGFLIGRGGRREPSPLVIERPVQSASQAAAVTQPAAPVEQVYTCGARTKKGKPCSRRVHGPVRCWQHRGMPAMLPPEKLIIKD